MTRSATLRAAVIGTGAIAQHRHLPALRAQPRVEVVAAVDVDPDRLAAFQAAHRVERGYRSVPEMLAAEQPDLVHVCTPPFAHVEPVVQALRAGAWVLVEKPACLSLAEHDRITEAERDGGPYASVVCQHRFGSAGRHAAQLLAEGHLGRPLVADCRTTWYRDHSYYEVPWRGRWHTEGGGPTMGHGIHQMDLLLALLGDWAEIQAMAARLDRDVDTEDVSMAIVRFAGGALASIVNSVLSPREESYLRIDCTDATLELTHLYGYGNADWRYTAAPHVSDPARIRSWSTPPGQVRSSHAAQLDLLLEAVDAGTRPPASGETARQTLELITGLYRSAFTGTTVRREQLTPDDPFYHHLHGGTPGWAPTGSGRGATA
ncbi:gfo/Idh/MocA family oxidoreductase [Saccharopolyspora rhizosphaerae]|uniref:Gfo/Idh/MocA family oxidoreductase n=1 Tax=Saccharopolyspora rhizosphaerae TaxID=2492662 RepID=A0A3R8QGE1_9PSEU|nr:Gfo/Idh/MocA family oxidoreductase [Saccharopolyspora rhizosphaerae]RRO20406.1 gfo/Idh/MocA family oxidoreductase [Saccharopolyspora rhizosphaerae]